MNGRHLDPAEVTAFVDGELAGAARFDAARHLETCAACRAEIDASTAARRLLRLRTAAALAAHQPLDFSPRNRRLGQPSLMRSRVVLGLAAAAVLSLAIVLRPTHVEATGVIGDSACGLTHPDTYAGDRRACTLNCVRRGAEFVLLAGQRIYRIENQAFDNLAAFANLRVTITGTLDDDVITVSKIVAVDDLRVDAAEPRQEPRPHRHRPPETVLASW